MKERKNDVLVLAPISYVEFSPAFNGDVKAQNEFLGHIWVQHDFRGSGVAVISAHKAWYEHILRKRKGEATKRPIADVMIGAYALQKGGLITRNEDDLRSFHPNRPFTHRVKKKL